MPADTDRELVKRAQQGDSSAFDRLFERHVHKIRMLARTFVDTAEDAEDVAQDTFIKAYNALPRFRNDSAFYTWIYRIATNTAKNFIAARSRRPQSSDLDPEDESRIGEAEASVESENPIDTLYGEELEVVVKDAFDELPLDLRTALTLRESSGLSYIDIADIMQCPVGTVRSRIFRAREHIDQRVKKYSRRG